MRYPRQDEYAHHVRRLLRAAVLRASLVGGEACLLGCAGPVAQDAKIVSPSPGAATPAQPQDAHRVAAPSHRYVVAPERSRVLILAGSVLGEHPVEVSRYQGDAEVVETELHESRVRVTLELSSVAASTRTLTDLIKSDRVLDVAQYPTASFVSEKIVLHAASTQSYQITGTLTLHGVSKTVEVLGQVRRDGRSFVASSRFSLRRQDFGIKPGGLLGLLIHDDVVVDLRLVAVPKRPP